MTWLTENELKEKGIKFGKNVRISDSCKINCEDYSSTLIYILE